MVRKTLIRLTVLLLVAAAVSSESVANPGDEVRSVCGCRFIYKPVCGTDNKIYPTQCVLKCLKTKGLAAPDVRVLHKGIC